MTNTDKKKDHIFVPNPNPEWNIKIANKDAVTENYGSKIGREQYDDVETGAVECIQKSCNKFQYIFYAIHLNLYCLHLVF